MAHDAHCNQGGERVADHGQPHDREEAARQHGKLEGQLRNLPPRVAVRSEAAGQRAHRQDRYAEGAVLSVAIGNRPHERGAIRTACGVGQPLRRIRNGAPRLRAVLVIEGERGPSEGRRADVADAAVGVAPAAVRVPALDQPSQPGAHESPVAVVAGGPRRKRQSRNRRRGRESAARERPLPAALRRPLGQQTVDGRAAGGFDGHH